MSSMPRAPESNAMPEVTRQDRQPPGPGVNAQPAQGAREPDQVSYREQFCQEVDAILEDLTLAPLQKHYVRSRWLDQTLWMESRSARAQKFYVTLQLVTIVGGILIPALVSLDGDKRLHWLTIALGLMVAVSAALEGFFHFGDRWKQFRRDVELLKGEFWQFSQRSGPYQGAATQGDAYPTFVNRVEQILQKNVEAYFTQVVQTKKDEKPQGSTA